MNRPSKLLLLLNIVGLTSGIVAMGSILVVGDTFGLPGSTAHRTYRNFNRIMASLILLEVCPLAAFYLGRRTELTAIGRSLMIVAIVAWIGMSVGTAAEFWLFSHLPYGDDNLRSAAFSLFSMSGLIVGVGLTALGIVILLDRQLPRYIAVLLMLYLPVDLALFLGDASIFLTSALFSVSIAARYLWSLYIVSRFRPRRRI